MYSLHFVPSQYFQPGWEPATASVTAHFLEPVSNGLPARVTFLEGYTLRFTQE